MKETNSCTLTGPNVRICTRLAQSIENFTWCHRKQSLLIQCSEDVGHFVVCYKHMLRHCAQVVVGFDILTV